MERGIRQGCPVSAILFIFIIEILATRIRSGIDIKGFTVDGTGTVKIVQHADDCTNTTRLSNKLLEQGYVKERLRSSLRKFYGRYGDLIKQYEVPLSRMLNEIFCAFFSKTTWCFWDGVFINESSKCFSAP